MDRRIAPYFPATDRCRSASVARARNDCKAVATIAATDRIPVPTFTRTSSPAFERDVKTADPTRAVRPVAATPTRLCQVRRRSFGNVVVSICLRDTIVVIACRQVTKRQGAFIHSGDFITTAKAAHLHTARTGCGRKTGAISARIIGHWKLGNPAFWTKHRVCGNYSRKLRGGRRTFQKRHISGRGPRGAKSPAADPQITLFGHHYRLRCI